MTVARVLIADDHVIMREGVALILNARPEFEVVGQAINGEQGVRLAEALQPDLALLDISMPEMDGITAARHIHAACPQTRTLILTMHDDEEIFFATLQAGASGYVLKGSSPSELIDALQAALKGHVYISPPMTGKLVNNFLHSKDDNEVHLLDFLTVREREIMQMLAQGYTNREIAGKLMISPSTVQTHRTHIMEKLKLNNRTELVRYAIRHKLLPPR
jgi:two-component system response regulator NreC